MTDRAHWTYLGSSDAPPILGVPSYGRTALDVWDEKLRQGVEREPSALMRWGLILEPVILREYAKSTGHKVSRAHRQRFLEGHPWIGCRIDADAGDRLVEAKFSPFERDYGEPADGAMGLPMYVRAQVQHQLLVSGYDRADVPVLLRGYDLRIFEVEADREYQADLLEELDDFWHQHVETRIPPELDDPEQLAEYLARKPGDGTAIEAPADLRPVFRRLAIARHDKSDAEHREKAAKAILIAAMGLAETMTGADVTITLRAPKGSDEVSWDLVATAYRKRLEELGALTTEQLDALVSMFTSRTTPSRRFVPKFTGELADLEAITPQVEGVPDAATS